MQTLDYKSPDNKRPTVWLFWPAFVAAYWVGLIFVGIMDDVRDYPASRVAGNPGISIFGTLAFPFFVVIAIVIKVIWKRCNSLPFAIIFAVLAPILTYSTLWLIAKIFKLE